MKFYVINAPAAGTIGCEFSLSKAVKQGKEFGYPEFTVDRITINGSPREALRLLLGNLGGFAEESETVYESKRASDEDAAAPFRMKLRTTEVQS